MDSNYQIEVSNTYNPEDILSLWEDNPDNTVFNHPYWWQSNIEAFGENRKLYCLTVKTNGSVCAYWAFWVKRLYRNMGYTKIIEPVGSASSDYTSPIIKTGYPVADLANLMISRLKRLCGMNTILSIPKVRLLGEGNLMLDEQEMASGAFLHRSEHPCYRLRFPETYEELSKQWKGYHRRNVNQAVRRLSEEGELSLFVTQNSQEILDRLPTFFALHTKQWGSKEEFHQFSDARQKQFFQSFIRALPDSMHYYSEVRLDGKAVSIHYNFIHQGWLLGYKSTYDIDFSKKSPTRAHLSMMMERAISQGLKGLDFMQGVEKYKEAWKNEQQETTSYVLASKLGYPVWKYQTEKRERFFEFVV